MSNNLDVLINKIGFEIVNKKIIEKNLIDKMLGVLANDGVYAWWVYTKKELNWKFVSDEAKFKEFEFIKLILLLNEFDYLFGKILLEENITKICELQKNIEEKQKEKKDKNNNDKRKLDNEIKKLKEQQNSLINQFFIKLSEDLNNLLFFREVIEKILIYARYHAKAMGD